MSTIIIQILLLFLLTMMGTSCRRPSDSSNQEDISKQISDQLRESMNPFNSDQKARYVQIRVKKISSAISYSINDRPMTLETLDVTLGKLAEIDHNQTLAIELDPDVTSDDLTALIALLKKHQLKNAARRGENNQAIWILD